MAAERRSMRNIYTMWWLAALVAAASVASIWIAWGRHRVEIANSAVELCMDYREGVAFARRMDMPVASYLQSIRRAGIVSVAVDETTLGNMESDGEVILVRGAEVLYDYGTPRLSREIVRAAAEAGVSASDTIVVPLTQDAAAFLTGRLPVRLSGGPALVTFKAGAHTGFAISVPLEDASAINLGIRPSTLDRIHAAGLKAVLRLSNFTGVTERWIDSATSIAQTQGTPYSVIFAGAEVLGYPGLVSVTSSALQRNGMRYGDVEFLSQAGGASVASSLSSSLVRVHSITRAEVDRGMTPDAMRDRYVRAARERNIRVLYLRPILKPVDNRGLVELNDAFIRDLAAAIEASGLRLGPAEPMGQADPGLLPTLIVVIGVAAGAVMLLVYMCDVPLAISVGLVAVAAAGFAGLWSMGRSALARQTAALAAAIVFPSITAFVLLEPVTAEGREHGKRYWRRRTVVRFLAASALSLAGGMMLAGCLTSLVFMVKVKQFMGVKLMHVAPFIFLVIAYWKYYARQGVESPIASLARMGRSPILWWQAALVVIIGLAGLIYLTRTGNTSSIGLTVPAIEQRLRAFLEKVLPVRPRTKEFLLGHPAFLIAGMLVALGDRTLLLPIAALALIGQISLVNTFAHMHTPIHVTVTRVLLGAGAGLIVGIVAAWAYRQVSLALRRAAGR